MWDDVGDYVVKIATELGINPSGAQADVAARLGVVDDRLTAVEGATSAAGAEVGSATLTSPYSIYQQASSTTWTDIGLSIPVRTVMHEDCVGNDRRGREPVISLDNCLHPVGRQNFESGTLSRPGESVSILAHV